MSSGFIVTGTDTGVGKTVFCAALTVALGGAYWKPVQAGREGGTDCEVVTRLTAGRPCRIFPEVYCLTQPQSPHLAARYDGVEIDPGRLALPDTDRPLIVEGAGGVLVPLRDDLLYADVMTQWGLPVILCARTSLGTINHTLLSIEALRARGNNIFGVAFIGDANDDVARTIETIGKVMSLGRLPFLPVLTGRALHEAFVQGFTRQDFIKGLAQ